MKAVRSWARSSARRLTFYAPYWIVNKTGLALNYRARLFLRSTIDCFLILKWNWRCYGLQFRAVPLPLIYIATLGAVR